MRVMNQKLWQKITAVSLAAIVSAISILAAFRAFDGVYFEKKVLPKGNYELIEFAPLVYYDDHIYISYWTKISDEDFELIKGDRLGYATGNIDQYYNKYKYTNEFPSRGRGDIYSVKGYDKKYVIAINEYGRTRLFIRDNDIRLRTGKDYYEKFMHLKGNITAIIPESYQNIDTISTNDLELFIEALYKAKYADIQHPGIIYDKDKKPIVKSATIKLKLKDGNTATILMYENGYIRSSNLKYYLHVTDPIFKKVYDACSKPVE